MALTNIELYEALKRDLSEDSARMIAEVVPAAADLSTKIDVSQLELAMKTQLLEMEQRLDRRMTSMERRYYLIIGVPLWGGAAAALVKYVLG